jgi:hypothetical protein
VHTRAAKTPQHLPNCTAHRPQLPNQRSRQQPSKVCAYHRGLKVSSAAWARLFGCMWHSAGGTRVRVAQQFRFTVIHV